MALMSRQRWIALILGSTLAIAVGGLGALVLSRGHKDEQKMNDQPTGLTFNVSDPTPTLDSKKPLRCFVNGAYVGDLTLADCAKKNGMSAQKLDVGFDDAGNATAAPTASLVPVPGAPVTAAPSAGTQAPEQTDEVVPDTHVAAGPTAACLRFNSNSWNRLSDNLTLGQCAILLFDQRCVAPGQASYGRWGGKTLRLVPKRVEISDDNANFRQLVDQQGCSVPMVH